MTKTEIDAILMRIEIRMAELGMAKEDFYAQSKISSASYSQWNTGTHKPTKKKLADAARVLNVSLEYLLTGEKENKPTENGELTETQREAIELVMKIPDEKLQVLIAALKATMGE